MNSLVSDSSSEAGERAEETVLAEQNVSCKYVAEALVLNGVSTETCINDPKYQSSVKND